MNGGEHITAVLSRSAYDAPLWCRSMTDTEAFFSLGLDGVIVSTGPESHVELALRAIESGAGVLVEKPLALDWSGCARIIEAAQKSGLPLLVSSPHLWAERFVAKLARRPEQAHDVEAHFGGPAHSGYSDWLDWGPHLVAMSLAAFRYREPHTVDIYCDRATNFARFPEWEGRTERVLRFRGGSASLEVTQETSRFFRIEYGDGELWDYDDEDHPPDEHTPMWHMARTFQDLLRGGTDQRADLSFTRAIYGILFGEQGG